VRLVEGESYFSRKGWTKVHIIRGYGSDGNLGIGNPINLNWATAVCWAITYGDNDSILISQDMVSGYSICKNCVRSYGR
jgi:hypothetical protein